jgi:hypothetical protein
MGRHKTYGFAFSWRRAIGISARKARISRAIHVPLTGHARQRKLGRKMGCTVLALATVLVLLTITRVHRTA